ncbi:hypothetical protein VP01_6548g1 [Puccinia sorghi]|uniref:Uncharacterized protein n=1 Tax=Puccinia sorghi TaxID=27349 RepID=A0A0L6UG93_9BASI|nr:hypothetical protein VP01_6548g1 [Puccinia sorghi]
MKDPQKKEKKKETKKDRNEEPHNQKTELLEGIANFISKVVANDNRNLEKIGWKFLMERINNLFRLTLSRNQIIKHQQEDLGMCANEKMAEVENIPGINFLILKTGLLKGQWVQDLAPLN